MTYEEAIIQLSFIKNFGLPQDIAMLSNEVGGDESTAILMGIQALELANHKCSGCIHENKSCNEAPCNRCQRINLDYYEKGDMKSNLRESNERAEKM